MDASGRLAGRGAYLCVDPGCRRTALARNILSRALGVPLPDDLRSELELPDHATGLPSEGAAVTRRTALELNNKPDIDTPGGTIGQE